MKKISKFLLSLSLILETFALASVVCSCHNDDDEKTLKVRNLYFNEWSGGDSYTKKLEEKFDLSIVPSNYSWADWDSQVNTSISMLNFGDVFHFSLDNYNMENSMKTWAKGELIKPLPDMDTLASKWPNLKKILDNTSNLDALKIDGKLYCFPIAKDINNTSLEFSPFTYVYRRDWAKELGVYQEDDVYTWDQFKALLDAFYKAKCNTGDFIALADVEWGFPSIVNFYKNAPHCFTTDPNTGLVVNNYTTSKYLEGLEIAKEWASGTSKYYGYDQYSANDGDIAKQFYAGRVGVYFENLSLSNYTTLRKKVSERSEIKTKEDLDDATALLKIKGPDGKFALEGTNNWFSATFFNYDMSESKFYKVLDMMDYLVSEEGTLMAAYGIEGYDYEIVNNEVKLIEEQWEKDKNGNYVERYNGAKYLRYLATLGYDMQSYDPLVDQSALKILSDWEDFMSNQKDLGNLRILKEEVDVEWLYTPNKAKYSGTLLEKANTNVTKYCYGKMTMDEYLNGFSSKDWTSTITEINSYLGRSGK